MYKIVHIAGQEWEYVVGRRGIKIRNPNGGTSWFPIASLLGLSPSLYIKKFNEMREAQYNQCDPECDGCKEEIIAASKGVAVIPSKVKSFIIRNFNILP